MCESSVPVIIHAGMQTGRETVEHSDASSHTSGDTHTFTYNLCRVIALLYCADVKRESGDVGMVKSESGDVGMVKSESGDVGMVKREVKSEPVPSPVSAGEVVVCFDIVSC